MKVGIYGDVHLTKNMRTLQDIWEDSAKKSIIHMYNKFDREKVDFAVCLGDFFDKPILEAKSLHLVLPIINWMNTREYPTYLLLGNHEIESDSSNILEYLSEYDNIKPVTDWDVIQEDFLFLPYNIDITEVDPLLIKDRYVFTHHDIYGSDLAGGKTKAFFGIDPGIFKDAKGVFNGHVHLKSQVTPNVINAGSLLVSQQGELRVGKYPSYYILDTEDVASLLSCDNTDSMIYLNIEESDIEFVTKYDSDRLVLRVDYEGEIPEDFIKTAHTSWRKKVSSIESESSEVIRTSNFDLKNYLTEYINKDDSIQDKESYIKVGMEVLG